MPEPTSEIVVTAPRRTSPRGRQFMASWEKTKLRAYRDGGKVWTIGIGHTGTDPFTGKPVRPGLVWTPEQAAQAFALDLEVREGQLNRMLADAQAPTSQAQYDALLSLGFNVGMLRGGLLTSTLLGMHKAGEYAAAAKQFPRWNHDNGVVVAGLTARRKAEADIYLHGLYVDHA